MGELVELSLLPTYVHAPHYKQQQYRRQDPPSNQRLAGEGIFECICDDIFPRRAQYSLAQGAEPFHTSPQRQGRVALSAPVKAAMSSSVMQSAHVLSVSTSGGSGLGGRGGGEGEAMGGGLGGGTQ
jgi:hypothetical protein